MLKFWPNLDWGNRKNMTRAKTQRAPRPERKYKNGLFTGGKGDDRDELRNFVFSVLSC